MLLTKNPQSKCYIVVWTKDIERNIVPQTTQAGIDIVQTKQLLGFKLNFSKLINMYYTFLLWVLYSIF